MRGLSSSSVSSSRRGGRRRFVSEINVVPYIDVMLVLLVIVMVTAPLQPPGQIEVPGVPLREGRDGRVVQDRSVGVLGE